MLCVFRFPTILDTFRLVLIALHIVILIIGSMLIYYGGTELFVDKILNNYFILFFGNPEQQAISIGIFISFVSIIGLIVTCLCKDVSILKMHLLFLVLIALYQIANCIDIFALNQLPDFMKKNMMYGINYYKFNLTDKFSIAWSTIQDDQQCCGIYGYEDWLECDECLVLNEFPKSCCQNAYNQCLLNNTNLTSEENQTRVFPVGCFSMLVKMIDQRFLYSLQWFSLFILIQLLIIIFSYMHISHIDCDTKLGKDISIYSGPVDWESDDSIAINETTKMIPRKRIKDTI